MSDSEEEDKSLKGTALSCYTSVSCKHKAQSCSVTEGFVLFFPPAYPWMDKQEQLS